MTAFIGVSFLSPPHSNSFTISPTPSEIIGDANRYMHRLKVLWITGTYVDRGTIRAVRSQIRKSIVSVSTAFSLCPLCSLWPRALY
jgi:hypothetical protein